MPPMHATVLLLTVAGVLLLTAPFTLLAAATPGAQRAELFDEPLQGKPSADLRRKLAQAGPYSTTFTGITAIDYLAMLDSYTAHGLIPTSLRGYYDDASKRALYDVTFSPNSANQTVIAKHALDNDAYEKQSKAAAAQGYTLRSNSPYEVGGVQYHAALWTKPQGPVAAAGNSTLQAG